MVPDHDIFLCRWQGLPVAAHVILLDRPARARLLLSGGADRNDERFHSAVGPGNRLLHWTELQYYKAEGYRSYDFGGCNLNDKKSPEYAIALFKQSFGAAIVEEPMLYLARNPALRALLHTHALARNALRKLPWPQSWLEATRTRPRLFSWLR